MHILETERQVASFLSDAAITLADCDDIDIAVETFQAAGVMSANQGFVMRAGPPGSHEFQITIIRSR
jgi:hypothetical protein